MATASPWTEEKIAELKRLKAAGVEWKEIVVALGLTMGQCKFRWTELTQSAERKRKRQDRSNFSRRRARKLNPKINRAEVMDAVPDFVWIERDARLNEPMTITAYMCGDPPPSRSALAGRVPA